MKAVIFALTLAALTCLPNAKADDDFSILYPKQIQPRLTTRQRCRLDNEWKKHGSMKECIEEKRHEEVLSQQKKTALRQEELAEEAVLERQKIRAEARFRNERETFHQTVKTLTGSR